MVNFKILIKECRKAKGLTEKQLADKAGISQGYLDKIEKGLKIPSLPTLEKLGKALRIDPSQLIIFDVNYKQDKKLNTILNHLHNSKETSRKIFFTKKDIEYIGNLLKESMQNLIDAEIIRDEKELDDLALDKVEKIALELEICPIHLVVYLMYRGDCDNCNRCRI